MRNKERPDRSSCSVREVGGGADTAHCSGNLPTVDALGFPGARFPFGQRAIAWIERARRLTPPGGVSRIELAATQLLVGDGAAIAAKARLEVARAWILAGADTEASS